MNAPSNIATRTVGDIIDDNAPQASGMVVDGAAGLLAVISRAASDPTTDVDKIERLMALYERMSARQAEADFNEAMSRAQNEIKPVVKNKYNEQTKSRYSNLEAVANAIDPIIHKHGFSLSYGTDVSPLEGHHRITCKVARGGHSEMRFADVPADIAGIKGTQNKTATHAFGSTASYGRRYLKLMIFDVATTDDDDGQRAGASPDYEMIGPDQCAELRRLIKAADTTEEAFVAHIGSGTLPELAAIHFERAKGILVKRIDAIKAGA